jgi:hypothetical protein
LAFANPKMFDQPKLKNQQPADERAGVLLLFSGLVHAGSANASTSARN